jgi:hypothetical protein
VFNTPHEADETANRPVLASTVSTFGSTSPSSGRSTAGTLDTFSVCRLGFLLDAKQSMLLILVGFLLSLPDPGDRVHRHWFWLVLTAHAPRSFRPQEKEEKRMTTSPATCVRVPGRIWVQITLFRPQVDPIRESNMTNSETGETPEE